MSSRRGFTLIEGLVVLCMLGILLALLLPAIDYARATPRTVPGVVVGKAYQGAETHVGTGISGKGDVVLVTSSSPEQYTLIVEAEDWVESCAADSRVWAKVEKGSPVTVRIWTGRLFGGRVWSEVVDAMESGR